MTDDELCKNEFEKWFLLDEAVSDKHIKWCAWKTAWEIKSIPQPESAKVALDFIKNIKISNIYYKDKPSTESQFRDAINTLERALTVKQEPVGGAKDALDVDVLKGELLGIKFENQFGFKPTLFATEIILWVCATIRAAQSDKDVA